MSNLLKKLELFGFKSFADKTVLEFSKPITAIVGPNGSGKSNVIDAIRWLLGERESKNLRGAKSDDLIFAGSSKKSRMGLARASLYFDNKNNFFPVDFSEIIISREVSRDGLNQYYLNKSEIRLKDLIDFLAKARLGTEGMVVVTQGNSDVFVRANPEERREMIEETLGLKEYRLKKNEAIRKLKNTKINLDKVNALIEEILPHLRSLKRQTSRWEKRSQIEDELNNSLKLFFGKALFDINSNLKNIEDEIRKHLELKNKFLEQKEKAENKLKEIELSQPKEREKLKEIKLQIEELNKKRNDFQKEIVKLEFHIEKLRNKNISQKDIKNEDLIELISKIKSNLLDIINTQIDFNQIKNKINLILEDIDKIFKIEKNDEKEYLIVQKDLEKINQDLIQIDNKIKILKEQELKIEKSQDNFYILYKEAVDNLRLAENDLEKWNNYYQNLLFEKEKIEIKFNEIKHQIEQFNHHISEFQNLTNLENNFNAEELERKILRLRGELAAIGEIDEALLKEAKETEERYSFLENQMKDLTQASIDLNNLIKELNLKIENEFNKAFSKINLEFDKFFKLMFGGGYAKLKLVSLKNKKNNINELDSDINKNNLNDIREFKNYEDEVDEKGIEIEIKLPMKKLTSLDVLSGGERSLVGIAALFAIISVSPPPFLVLDEVDAMLDERNARKFSKMLKEFSNKTQFIIVTHNRAVMEAADLIYGVTLGEDETSKIVSLKLES
ncbi:MAG: AAA family ATPase [Patescibacteria group bacterium]|nr:AAA family ATPase [Patescibacteria group bacterium]